VKGPIKNQIRENGKKAAGAAPWRHQEAIFLTIPTLRNRGRSLGASGTTRRKSSPARSQGHGCEVVPRERQPELTVADSQKKFFAGLSK
jgi:hypothetical protein